MITRIALFVGSIAAAGVLALGLAAAGFGPATTLGDSGAAGDQALADTSAQLPADPAVQVQTETIYVRPAPAPKVIHVTRKLPAAQPKAVAAPRRTTRSGGENEHENENEHEGQDD